MKQNEYVNKKEIGRALEEVEKGLITIKQQLIFFAKKIVPFGTFFD